MRYRLSRLVALVASGSLAMASVAFGAAAGDPDPTFGTNGIVRTILPDPPVLYETSEAYDLVQQADGKPVVGGYFEGGTPRFAHVMLARYDTAGVLDPSFGTGGVVVTDAVPGLSTRARSLLLQPDGKLIAVGFAASGVYWDAGGDVLLVRYLTDGSLDPDFGVGGVVVTDVFGHPDQGGDALLQPDGRIVVAGFSNTAEPTASRDALVARYEPDGTLDETFGAGGILALDLDGRIDRARAVALQADGAIVIAGTTNDPVAEFSAPSRGFVARIDADGVLDGGFGSGGVTELSLEFRTGITAMVVLPSGRILVDGSVSGDGIYGHSFLARYDADGVLDPAFGGGDGVLDPGPGSYYALDLDADGAVLAAGSGFLWGHWGAMGVSRLDEDGVLDATFGNAGEASIWPAPFAVNAASFAAVGASDGSTVTVAGFGADGPYGSTPYGEPRYVTVARFRGVGSACAGDGDCDACEHCDGGTCVNGPRTTCERPIGAAKLVYAGSPVTPKINWKWGKRTAPAGFDPVTDSVGLCMWWGTTPIYESTVPSGAGWKTSPTGLVTFRDKTRSNFGIEKIRVGKALEVKARGPKIQENPNGFPDALFSPADDTIRLHVQLNASSGKCWAATYLQANLVGKYPQHTKTGYGF
jgi:uncharacterized delta-60 repeat protein